MDANDKAKIIKTVGDAMVIFYARCFESAIDSYSRHWGAIKTAKERAVVIEMAHKIFDSGFSMFVNQFEVEDFKDLE